MNKVSLIRYEKQLISVFLLLVVILAAYHIVGQYAQRQVYSEFYSQIQKHLNYKSELVEVYLQSGIQEANFLSKLLPIQDLVRISETNNGQVNSPEFEQWRGRLESIYRNYLTYNDHLYQIRFIGVASDGKEIVNVEKRHAAIRTAHPHEMQSTSSQGYFQAISQMQPDQFHVSAIDLNRENGEIMFPLQPTFRIGTPVFNAVGQVFGMVVLTYDAHHIMRALVSGTPDYLVTAAYDDLGRVLLHPEKTSTFQFGLDHQSKWLDIFSQALNEEAGQVGFSIVQFVDKDDALFYLEESLPFSTAQAGKNLHLVVGIKKSSIETLIERQRTLSLLWLSLITLVVIGFTIFYIVLREKNIKIDIKTGQFQALFDTSNDGILLVDLDGTIISHNETIIMMLQYPGLFYHNKNVFDKLDWIEDQEKFKAAFDIVIGTCKEKSYSGFVNKNSGQRFFVSIFMRYMKPSRYAKPFISIVIRDKDFEAKVLENLNTINKGLEDVVYDRTRDLEKARDEALKADKAKSEFIANISHELRTPLNGINGMIVMLGKHIENKRDKNILDIMSRSTQHLQMLLNDILDYSKISSGSLDLEKVQFDLVGLSIDLMESMSMMNQEKKQIQILLDLVDVEVGFVVGDPTRYRQILTNLLNNAIKFTDKGHIKLTLASSRQDNGFVQLVGQVEDTGIGISSENLHKIFNVFSQEDESVTRQYGGTGLGLAISRQLCQLMNGDIAVESVKHKGSVFTFTLHFDPTLSEMPSPYHEMQQHDLHGIEEKTFIIIDASGATAFVLHRYLKAWGAASIQQVNHIDKLNTDLGQNTLIFLEFEALSDEGSYQKLEEQVLKAGLAKSQVICVGQYSDVDKVNQPLYEILVTPFSPFTLLYKLRLALNPGTVSSDNEDFEPEPAISELQEEFTGYTILIVDDNEINRAFVTMLLEHMNFSVISAEHGEDAIDVLKFSEKPVQLILMDCQMPVMDGYAATRAIRAGEAGDVYKDIPIVAMTANAFEKDQKKCFESGMTAYLAKPIDEQVFVQTLRKQLQYQARAQKVAENARKESMRFNAGENGESEASWDPDRLLKMLKGRETQLQKIVSLFLESAPETLKKLQAALEVADVNQVKAIAHNLKGATNLVECRPVAKMCSHLEAACELAETAGHEASIDVIQRDAQQIQLELDAVFAQMKQRIS